MDAKTCFQKMQYVGVLAFAAAGALSSLRELHGGVSRWRGGGATVGQKTL